MSEKQPSWIEQHYGYLIPTERETVEKLGKETAGIFVCAANDCLTVSGAVTEAYPGEKSCNLVLLTLYG